MRIRRTIVAVLGAVLVTATAVPAASAQNVASPTRTAGAAAAVPPDFIGLVSDDAFANPGDYRTSAFARQAAMGVRTIRVTFKWAQIETSPDTYDFTGYDAYVGDAARAGLHLLPILFDPPVFRARAHTSRGTYPPNKYADLGTFGATLVNRYGPNGSYWTENPSVPKLPIRSWQVWNEPNLKAYWPTGPNAAQYVRLLKATRGPIKRADPGAEIVSAGMPESRVGIPLETYVPAMYRAGARGAFDTLAVNPYGPDVDAVVKVLTDVRQLMDDNRDKRSKIWATELGWSDTGPASPQRVGPAGQAKNVAAVVTQLAAERRALKLRGLVYFDWRDASPYAGGVDFWGLHTGLLRKNGTPKRAFSAFRSAIARIAGK